MIWLPSEARICEAIINGVAHKLLSCLKLWPAQYARGCMTLLVHLGCGWLAASMTLYLSPLTLTQSDLIMRL